MNEPVCGIEPAKRFLQHCETSCLASPTTDTLLMESGLTSAADVSGCHESLSFNYL